MRCLLSWSLLIALVADHDPVRIPVSPPKNRLPIPSRPYVAMSPATDGFRNGVISGISAAHRVSALPSPSMESLNAHRSSRPQIVRELAFPLP